MAGPVSGQLRTLRARAADKDRMLSELADQVLLPALAQNYLTSGLKMQSGLLYRGVSQRGALGNYVRVGGGSVVVGISYQEVPYARFQLEGTRPHTIRARHPGAALRFRVGGKWVFAKSVNHPGTSARTIYRLTPAQLDSARRFVKAWIEGRE